MANKPARLTDAQLARFNEGLARKKWNQSDLARAAGIRNNTLSDALGQKTGVQAGTFAKICDALGMDRLYVETGKGSPWADSPAAAMPPPRSLGVDLWLTEADAGRRTTAEERAYLRDFAWPDAYMRYPDEAYSEVLESHRKLRRLTIK